MYIFICTYVYLYIYKTMTIVNYKVTIFALVSIELNFDIKL